MGLKHLPFVNIVFFLLNILIGITFGGESLSGRPWVLVEGQRKMLVDFAMVIGVVSIPGTCQTNSFLMSFFPIIITKEIFGRNGALISFVGRITTIVARRKDG
jgi:hypothetical protein